MGDGSQGGTPELAGGGSPGWLIREQQSPVENQAKIVGLVHQVVGDGVSRDDRVEAIRTLRHQVLNDVMYDNPSAWEPNAKVVLEAMGLGGLVRSDKGTSMEMTPDGLKAIEHLEELVWKPDGSGAKFPGVADFFWKTIFGAMSAKEVAVAASQFLRPLNRLPTLDDHGRSVKPDYSNWRPEYQFPGLTFYLKEALASNSQVGLAVGRTKVREIGEELSQLNNG